MAAAMAGVLVTVDHFGEELSSWWLAPSLALGGIATGMVAPTLVDVTLAGVHGRDAGSASGVLNSALQLGCAIGVALIGVIYFDVIASEGFVEALRDSLWFEVAIYLLGALAMLLLPKQAIATYGEPSLELATVES
jgi:predicted MFS family arabinose efflux permease